MRWFLVEWSVRACPAEAVGCDDAPLYAPGLGEALALMLIVGALAAGAVLLARRRR